MNNLIIRSENENIDFHNTLRRHSTNKEYRPELGNMLELGLKLRNEELQRKKELGLDIDTIFKQDKKKEIRVINTPKLTFKYEVHEVKKYFGDVVHYDELEHIRKQPYIGTDLDKTMLLMNHPSNTGPYVTHNMNFKYTIFHILWNRDIDISESEYIKLKYETKKLFKQLKNFHLNDYHILNFNVLGFFPLPFKLKTQTKKGVLCRMGKGKGNFLFNYYSIPNNAIFFTCQLITIREDKYTTFELSLPEHELRYTLKSNDVPLMLFQIQFLIWLKKHPYFTLYSFMNNKFGKPTL